MASGGWTQACVSMVASAWEHAHTGDELDKGAAELYLQYAGDILQHVPVDMPGFLAQKQAA